MEKTEISRGRACITWALHACRKLRNVSVCLSGQHPSSAKLASYSLMMTLLRGESRLESLSLVAVDYNSADPNSDWERLGERCGDLRELHIENVHPFDVKCLEHLTRQSTSLAKLTLQSLPDVRYFSRVAMNYNSGDPHSVWERLGERCGALRELHIKYLSTFDDKCLELLTRQSTSLAKLTL